LHFLKPQVGTWFGLCLWWQIKWYFAICFFCFSFDTTGLQQNSNGDWNKYG